jgi:hypothetical protein
VRRARELLELQRATLRLFTSCAWFFDDVDRIETRQVLRYAARVLELSHRAGRLEPEFVHWLESAQASAPQSPSASDVFVRAALPHRQSAWSVAAGAIAMAAAGQPCARIAATMSWRRRMAGRAARQVPDIACRSRIAERVMPWNCRGPWQDSVPRCRSR